MKTYRECDGCTKCCEGWLEGEAYGHAFFKGRPCFFLAKSCTIYESRPEKPCRSFVCGWKAEDTFPQWMKPNLVNAIINKVSHDNIPYYVLVEAGSKLDSSVLSWMIQWALNTNNNLLYYIDGGINRVGSREFLNLNIGN
jgi:hypothetical protein